MKKQTAFKTILSLAFVGLFSHSAFAQTAVCEKIVRWNEDPPFYMEDAKGQITGIDHDLIIEIFKRIKCKPKFVKLPWARALSDLEAGQLDVLTGAYATPERQAFALFSKPYGFSSNILYVRKADLNKWKFKKLADMIGTKFRLGSQINVAYSDEYNELIKDPKFKQLVSENATTENLWKMLAGERVDGVIGDEFTAYVQLKEMKLEKDIVRSKFVVSSEPSFVAFSKKTVDQAFVDKFDSAVATIRKNGIYKKTLEKYIGKQD